ncbi:MAG: radical SAM protein [Proteobacteria bacterium]|nr:radical SAM protein [Pseudomonadota bacterium]MBU1060773.1 radical SAM protein [Pseudomonadota bacterium]
MKLALIATPHTHPTCPPLGPAVLSAYLQKTLPTVTVSVFDLSLEYYLSSFGKIKEGTLGIRLYNWDEKTTAHHLEQAISFLKNWQPKSHPDLKEYHYRATIFLTFENIFNAFMAEMAEKALLGQSIPPKIESFFAGLIQPVLAVGPDLIGFSILYQQQVVFAALLAQMIKKRSDVKIVVGGANISVMVAPETLLTTPLLSAKADTPQIFCKDFFDYLIPGEGELGLSHLCQAEDVADLATVPNLIYFRKDELQINPPALVEIDTLPYPDFSHFKLDAYLTPEPVLPLMTSRGCPWGKCTFCTHHHTSLRYRTRRIEACVAEIKFLQSQYGSSLFYFYDEMIPPQRFKKLAGQIIEAGLVIHYGAYAKPVKQFDISLCRLIQSSGCRVLQWGVESASQRILTLMSKGTDIHVVKDVLGNSTRAGINNLVFILFGFPSETEEELQQTLTFIDCNRENIQALSAGTFVLTEGSQIHREPEKFFISRIGEKNKTSILHSALEYDISQGMTVKEVWQHFNDNQKFFGKIPLSRRFGTYREHLLIYGASQSGREGQER